VHTVHGAEFFFKSQMVFQLVKKVSTSMVHIGTLMSTQKLVAGPCPEWHIVSPHPYVLVLLRFSCVFSRMFSVFMCCVN